MSLVRELKKIALDLEEAMQNLKATMKKKAYLFEYEQLKDKDSFHKAIADELDSTYGEGMLENVLEGDIEKNPEYKNIPGKTKAKRDELLAAIQAMPDSAFPLVEPGENDAFLGMPSLWWESSDVWDIMLGTKEYSDFVSLIDEMVDWVQEQG